MYAHCITNLSSTEPRLTITTHNSGSKKIWYVGGQLASQGAHLTDEKLLASAKEEFSQYLGWLKPSSNAWQTLTIDRVEPLTPNLVKPDEAFAERKENFIQCFPTKLTLAPDLGDKVLKILDPPEHDQSLISTHDRASIGNPPW